MPLLSKDRSRLWFIESLNRSYRFWQPGGGFNVNLWTDAKTWEKIEYTLNNSVRRRLVQRPEDWECFSYRDYAAARTVGVVFID